MAGLYPNINFPVANFDWLGNLPAKMEEGRISRVRQSLSDLDLSTTSGLDKAAGRLASAGDLEGAKTLYAQSTARRGVEQRGEADRLYMEWLKKKAPGVPGGPIVSAPDEPPFSLSPGAAPTSPGAPPSSVFPSPPGQNVIPPGTLPGPQSAVQPPPAPSPTEQMLAQAEDAAASAPPVRLAQAGGPVQLPTIDVGPKPQAAPQSNAVPSVPLFIQSGQQQAPPGTVPAGPQAGFRPLPGESPERAAARRDAQSAADELITLGPKGINTPAGKILNEKLQSALQRAKLSQPERDYEFDRIQRAARGLSPITAQEFRATEHIIPERVKEADKAASEYDKTAQNARELAPIMDRLDAIMKTPGFTTGEGAKHYASIISGIEFLAKSSGIQVPEGALKDKIDAIVEPHQKAAALINEFQALTNRAVMAHAGSLSKAFSDADREFVNQMFPNIMNTLEGNKKILKYIRASAAHAEDVARVTRQYMKDEDVRATRYGVQDAVQKYKDEHPLFVHPDGTLTALGRKLQEDSVGPSAPGTPVGNALSEAYDYVRGIRPQVPQTIPQNIPPGSTIDTVAPRPGARPPAAPPLIDEEAAAEQFLRARGGPVAKGHPYVVGERGPEVFVPDRPGKILPHHEGKVYYHVATGRAAGRIKNGKPVHFRRRRADVEDTDDDAIGS